MDNKQKSHIEGLGFSSRHLFSPLELVDRVPRTDKARDTVEDARKTIHEILEGEDNRLLLITGPCSIHDETAAIDYATRLIDLRERLGDKIYLVMRVYFEKPRTTVGWKGLINDPNLDETFDIPKGLETARSLLAKINEMGMPAASEFLDPVVPHYFEDLISWVAIGARTTESQTHRQMASAIGIPVGFKNGIKSCEKQLIDSGLPMKIMVDCSHGNSDKDHKKQPGVFENVVRQRVSGNEKIVGVMLESNINGGNQSLGGDINSLEYGVSITDACVEWNKTEEIILWADAQLNEAG